MESCEERRENDVAWWMNYFQTIEDVVNKVVGEDYHAVDHMTYR